MFRKIHGSVGILTFFFSLCVYASACSNDDECAKWAGTHCACGVPGKCNGITAQNQSGMCQCYGAAGHCNKAIDDSAQPEAYVTPARVAPVGRGAPVRRGAVRRDVDVDIDRSR